MFEVEKDWNTESGLRAVCLMVNGESHRCGYVAVPKDHPIYKVGYSEHSDALKSALEAALNKTRKEEHMSYIKLLCYDGESAEPEIVFSVHGGLTYAGGNGEYPVDGEDLWWFGFDCAHYGDLTRGRYSCGDGTWRTKDYVVGECENLAKQLSAIIPDKDKH